MRPLLEVLGEIQNKRVLAESRLKQEIAFGDADLYEAQQNIGAGLETTGNKLHDGLVVVYGKELINNPKIVGIYEKVSEQLKDKAGQPIVLIHRQINNYGCTGFGGKGQAQVDTSTFLGISNGEDFVFGFEQSNDYLHPKRSIALPTSKYAVKGFRRNTRKVDEKLIVSTYPRYNSMDFDLGFDLDRGYRIEDLDNRDLTGTTRSELQKLKVVTLAVGHEGISNWLLTAPERRTITELHELREMCDVLGIEKTAPETPFQQRMIEKFEARERGQRSL